MASELSSQLKQAFQDAGEEYTIGQLVEHLDSKGFGMLLTLSPLPVALPFTPPGFTFPFGLLQLILAGQMLAGKQQPVLPEWVKKRKIVKKGNTSKMWGAMPGFMAKFEKFLKPRHAFVYQGLGPRILAICVALASAAMMVPFPVTNSVCAIGVFMVGLGFLEEDGAFGIIGGVISILSFLAVVGIFVFFFVTGRMLLQFDSLW